MSTQETPSKPKQQADGPKWLAERVLTIRINATITAPKNVLSIHDGCERLQITDPVIQIKHNADKQTVTCLRCKKIVATDVQGHRGERTAVTYNKERYALA